MLNVVLKACPSPPAASKWTKLGPAVDFILMGCLFGFWAPLWEAAFARLPFTRVTSKGGEGDEETVDERLAFQISQGKRYKSAMAMFQNRGNSFKFVVLAVSIEPLKFLTGFFLEASRDVQDPGSFPPLMTALASVASPLVTMQQYVASLLYNPPPRGSRVLLAAHFLGHDDVYQFAEHSPAEYKLLRRTLMASPNNLFSLSMTTTRACRFTSRSCRRYLSPGRRAVGPVGGWVG
jgi:hypothetical protein